MPAAQPTPATRIANPPAQPPPLFIEEVAPTKEVTEELKAATEKETPPSLRATPSINRGGALPTPATQFASVPTVIGTSANGLPARRRSSARPPTICQPADGHRHVRQRFASVPTVLGTSANG